MFVMRCTRLVLGVGLESSTLSSLDWVSSRMVSFRAKSNLFREPPWSSGPNCEAERGMASWSFQADKESDNHSTVKRYTLKVQVEPVVSNLLV